MSKRGAPVGHLGQHPPHHGLDRQVGRVDVEGIGGPGQSFMPQPQAIAAGPNPALVGTKLGLAGVGIQFDLERLQLGLTEFANGMTLNLQP